MLHLLLAKNRKRCPDRVPDYVEWSGIQWFIGDGNGTATSQQITGTSCGIRIRTDIQWIILPEDDGDSVYEAVVWIKISDTEFAEPLNAGPAGFGFSSVMNGEEFFVENGKWVTFATTNPTAGTSNAKTVDATVSVKNLSDGGTELASFRMFVLD